MGNAEYEQRPEILAYRVSLHDASLKDISAWRREVDKSITEHEGDIEALQQGFSRVEKAVTANTRVLVGLLTTIALSAVGVAFTVLAATGKI